MTMMDTIKTASLGSRRLPLSAGGSHGIDALPGPQRRIENRMEREVEAMALYALTTGVAVPPDMMLEIGRALPATDVAGDPASLPASSDTSSSAGPENRLAALAEAHFGLTKLIDPAKPGALLLLVEDRRANPFWNTFGAVPLVRWMQSIAVISLLLLLGVSLSNKVNAVNMTKGLLNLYGLDLLCVEIFLVAAAAIGASLANLKRLDRYISACTYERRFDSSYWTRLVMGVMSGIILSQVVYGAIVGHEPDTANTLSEFGQPVLALLGGFSADLVHDVLSQLIAVIGNLLGGKPIRTVAPTERPPG